ncbi:1,6-anhydro-N-acetylmuramyl-L-alanine amidase AmpD [Celerinatantimonas diazotrophica]|uniref:1,6-anhydro-N-acetylmuramyl-L-alanine amidase AmpD n=1 Tax=Celerinatantimonas diazotrophica TaxID=412034 RepID=A0A4V2PR91_9GAMM|nr:1,6-anhydro-N-acetylmuramyl-L-alanine amidase AmpD [Celerinatantimonas diazotrophica]TCK57981.1 AmpD protein [Celerinatantimonas diazotrophica]CAG9297950.1 1,6-anhydro-N-acetylmuramyl-L-alanine amidase AmpD [Celerinatantimonas diazotrophica]
MQMTKYLVNRHNSEDWLNGVRHTPSPFYNERPDPDDISLLVIHCISLPRGHYRNGQIRRLFTRGVSRHIHPELDDVSELNVSAHLVIDRTGEVEQFVPLNKRAWHAGVSEYNGRHNCNDFAIGIELEGTDDSDFCAAQYHALVALTYVIMQTYPNITPQRVVGHSTIAVGRKTDPGSGFNWSHYLALIQQPPTDVLNHKENEGCP